tara:strand:- start:1849 stop:2721 length:873 start_codon:yes stop_codon:yes gene_type:complete
MNDNHIKQSPMLTLPGMGGGSNSPLVSKDSSGPYKDVDATSIEVFWDGASDQISGSVWNSKQQHSNLSNANITMVGATYTSSVTGGDGSIGYWSFDGSNDYGWINDLNYGANGSHGPSNNGRLINFTIGTWFRTSFGTPNSGGAWDTSNWSWLDWDRSEVISWNIGTAGKLQFSGNSDGSSSYFDITGNGTYNDGQWHFGVCTVSATNNQVKFYGDGQPDGTRTVSHSYFGNGTRRWGIVGDGSEAAGNNGTKNNIYYNGDIAQQFLINEVWTDAKVLAHFTKTRSRFGV